MAVRLSGKKGSWGSFPSPWPERLLFKTVLQPLVSLPANPLERNPQQIRDDPINPRPPAIPSWNSTLGNGTEEEEIGKQAEKHISKNRQDG